MAAELRLLTCKECKQEFVLPPRPSGRLPHYCSVECRRRGNARATAERWREAHPPQLVELPTCRFCDRPVSSRQSTTCADRLCRNEHHRLRNRKYIKPKEKKCNGPCPYCGELMYSMNRASCGADNCRRLHNNVRQREFFANNPGYLSARFGEQRNDLRRAQRARKRQVKVERFSSRAVFERDGWACWICMKPTDPALFAKKDPLAPSLDHVVPLAKGGEHSMANSRCSHWICNSRRGARDVDVVRADMAAGVYVGGPGGS